MKSILLIHPFLPFPLTSGGHQALYNGIRAVVEDFDVTLVFEGDDTPETREAMCDFSKKFPTVKLRPLLKKRSTEIQSAHGKKFLFSVLWNFLRHTRDLVKKLFFNQNKHLRCTTINKDGISVQWWKKAVTPSSEEWVNHIYFVSREKCYDIIQVEMPWRIPDVFALPKNSKLVHVHHELGVVRRELEMKTTTNPCYQTYKSFADFNEIGQLNMYDSIITLSSVDSKKLKDFGVRIPIYSSFAIVDSERSITNYTVNPKNLVFLGPGQHLPNKIGIHWFLENCWNNIKSHDDEYKLKIIGFWEDSDKEPILKEYKDVYFEGYVEDIHTALSNSIMIVPITIGSGIRMKILEAANIGVPIVSTKVGAEGIDLCNGKDCFLTDDPDEFVKDIIKLQSCDLQFQFIKNANKLIKNHYSLESLRTNRRGIINTILSK